METLKPKMVHVPSHAIELTLEHKTVVLQPYRQSVVSRKHVGSTILSLCRHAEPATPAQHTHKTNR